MTVKGRDEGAIEDKKDMPPWLTADDLAARLQVTVKTVRNWTARGKVQFHRVGRQIRFTPEDVDALKETTAILPVPEPEPATGGRRSAK